MKKAADASRLFQSAWNLLKDCSLDIRWLVISDDTGPEVVAQPEIIAPIDTLKTNHLLTLTTPFYLLRVADNDK